MIWECKIEVTTPRFDCCGTLRIGKSRTESLPAGAGRFVLLKILKYGIVRDVAAGGGEVAPSPEMPPPVALAQVRELHLHLMR